MKIETTAKRQPTSNNGNNQKQLLLLLTTTTTTTTATTTTATATATATTNYCIRPDERSTSLRSMRSWFDRISGELIQVKLIIQQISQNEIPSILSMVSISISFDMNATLFVAAARRIGVLARSFVFARISSENPNLSIKRIYC
jgi:hypothetical protein